MKRLSLKKKFKKLSKDFQDFALKGSAFGTAIGIMLGTALTGVISSLIDNILMPPIAYITSGIDFADLYLTIGSTELTFKYGMFLNSFINFIITATILFLLTNILVKGLQKALAKEKAEEKKVRKCPYCFSEIHDDATRCPHCTSELRKK